MVDILDCCVYLELFAAILFVGHVIPHASPSPLLPTRSVSHVLPFSSLIQVWQRQDTRIRSTNALILDFGENLDQVLCATNQLWML